MTAREKRVLHNAVGAFGASIFCVLILLVVGAVTRAEIFETLVFVPFAVAFPAMFLISIMVWRDILKDDE